MTDEPRVSFDKQTVSFDGQGAPAGPPPAGPPPGYGYPPPNAGWAPYGYPPAGQPGPGYPGHGYPVGPAGPLHEKPSSNIGWAIAAVFTFWPLAIPSFLFANKVDTYWFAGNRAGAQQASRDARLWGMIGVIIGASFVLLAVIGIVVAFSVLAGVAHDVPGPTSFPTAYPS